MEEIAEKAGVAKGTVYLYFESKEALFRGLFEETLSNLLKRVDAATQNAKTGLDTLKAIFQSQVEFLEEHQDFIAQFTAKHAMPFSGPNKPLFASVFQKILQKSDEAARQAIQEGSIREVPLRSVSLALFATIRGFFIAHLFGLTSESFVNGSPFMWEFFVSGLGKGNK